jgi:radical SAM/Cys-rich protein
VNRLPLIEESTDFPAIQGCRLETLQVNVGYLCNQRCMHCHVDAAPERREIMDAATAGQVLSFLASSRVRTLDLTGGAPELNPSFRTLVSAASALGIRVIDRCNLTVLEEPGQEDLAEFLAHHGVEIIASMPCYLEENVDQQRGKGVYVSSVRMLKKLNSLGYGVDGTGLILNLVYNPLGPFLPPAQSELEEEYRRELGERHGIVFNRLLTITNMPIQRFGLHLVTLGQFDEYMDLLRCAHRDENVGSVMCQTLVNVDWQGYLYNCDFNRSLDRPLRLDERPRVHISELPPLGNGPWPIVVGEHCYGCTAGQGSSCGGALTS